VQTDAWVGDVTGQSDTEMTLDAVHQVLAHPTRRAVLRDLTARFHPMSIPDLAARLTTDGSGRRVSDDAFQECRIGLIHYHLPQLHAAGLIRYSPGEAVELTEKGFRTEGFRRAGVTYLNAAEEVRYPLGQTGSD